MEIENKLDEDFIFYLGFVNPLLRHIREKEMKHKCEQWLQKLCGEIYQGVEEKRCRNIYLSQLLIQMQGGALPKEFQLSPNEVDITKAQEVFNLEVLEIEQPAWVNDNEVQPEPEQNAKDKKGRTYLATRTLPGGQGAFAYVAISLNDEEPMYLGGGEGPFDQHMEEKYKEYVPDYEMEKILARRKNPQEREKVVTFYNVLLQNIEDELDEKINPNENETISGLLDQLREDMKDRGQFGPLKGLTEDKLRIELLLILHDRIKTRVDKVIKREEYLDEIETNILNKSVFETSVAEEDKIQLPAAMWEQAINKAPNKKNTDRLKETYPIILIEKFLELLSNYKEEIALRMQRRYENIISQMKKELRKEDEKGRKLVEEAQICCDNALEVLAAVKEAYTTRMEAEERNKKKTELPLSEHSKLYDQMRAALLDTQKCVEYEAAKGRALAAEINVVNEQTEQSMKANEEAIKKIETVNIATMTNIKRLNIAINQVQKSIRMIQTGANQKDGAEAFDIIM